MPDYGCKLNDISYWGTPYDNIVPYKNIQIHIYLVIQQRRIQIRLQIYGQVAIHM